MPTPVLHLIAGPNGSGKTTFYERILGAATGLPFINADEIAAERWPADPAAHAYEASLAAAELRDAQIRERRSFATETVFSHPSNFSHPSKLELLRAAAAAGYRTMLHVILVPEELAVARVALRVELGGHSVPENKIRERWRRLWPLVRSAIAPAQEAEVRDNSRAATPFRVVARYRAGRLVGSADWPGWTPRALVEAG